MFKSLFRRSKTPPGMVEVRVHDSSSPVIRYVSAMFYGMLKDGVGIRVLRQSEPLLPIVDQGDQLQPPPLDAIVNRLKVMAGLNPVSYSTPVEGTIRLTIGGKDCRAHCRFDDSTDDRCTVRMERDDTAQHVAACDCGTCGA